MTRPRIEAIVTLALLLAGRLLAQTDRDAGRDKVEKVSEILAALEAATSSRIADVGAGDGFHSAGLRIGGRLVIVEPIHDAMCAQSRAEQTAKHEISDDLTAEELRAAGFRSARKTRPSGPSRIRWGQEGG